MGCKKLERSATICSFVDLFSVCVIFVTPNLRNLYYFMYHLVYKDLRFLNTFQSRGSNRSNASQLTITILTFRGCEWCSKRGSRGVGRGSRTPEKSQSYRVSQQYCSRSPATKPAFIGPVKHHFTGEPMMVRFQLYLDPLSLVYINKSEVGPPLTNLSASAHIIF